MKKICLGGTFDPFHLGHKKLLRRAIDLGGELNIGITSDSMCSDWKLHVSPYEIRKAIVMKYLAGEKFDAYKIFPLEDKYGPALNGEFDCIVVSPETESAAIEMNKLRRDAGMKEILIIKIGFALAADGLPISSSRIKAGIISPSGERVKPIVVKAEDELVKKILSCSNSNYDWEVKVKVQGKYSCSILSSSRIISEAEDEKKDVAINLAIEKLREKIKKSNVFI